jgi:hypothetical protein
VHKRGYFCTRFWPGGVISDVGNCSNPMSAYRPTPAPRPLLLRIAGPGHGQSSEQINIGRECASFIKVIASIEDLAVIQKVFAHLDDNATSAATGLLPDTAMILTATKSGVPRSAMLTGRKRLTRDARENTLSSFSTKLFRSI